MIWHLSYKAITRDGDTATGIWWVRIFGRGLSLHAPWNRPLFSERNGHRKVLRLGFGWRVEWLPEPAIGTQRRIA